MCRHINRPYVAIAEYEKELKELRDFIDKRGDAVQDYTRAYFFGDTFRAFVNKRGYGAQDYMRAYFFGDTCGIGDRGVNARRGLFDEEQNLKGDG
jgi:hypothetical protein